MKFKTAAASMTALAAAALIGQSALAAAACRSLRPHHASAEGGLQLRRSRDVSMS